MRLVPRPHPQEGEGLVASERFLGLLRVTRKAILNQLEVIEIVLLLAKLSHTNQRNARRHSEFHDLDVSIVRRCVSGPTTVRVTANSMQIEQCIECNSV